MRTALLRRCASPADRSSLPKDSSSPRALSKPAVRTKSRRSGLLHFFLEGLQQGDDHEDNNNREREGHNNGGRL